MDAIIQESEGEVQILTVKGRIMQEDSHEFEERLEELLRREKFRIVLDFTEMKHICSTALGVMVSMKRKTRRNAGDIKIAVKEGAVKELLELTMLDKVFDLYDSRVGAVKHS